MTQTPAYYDILAKVSIPTPKAQEAMEDVGIDFSQLIRAVEQASQAFGSLAVGVSSIGQKMAEGFANGLKSVAETMPVQDKAKEAYLRRASRLNARPRQPKRHGERRGVK